MASQARPERTKLRCYLSGGPGTGKTWTSLKIATKVIADLASAGYLHGNGRIAILETERGTAKKYAKEFDEDEYGFIFDIVEINSFSPYDYMESLLELDNARYSLIIIDQITHEWTGRGGILEQHRKILDNKGERFAFYAWGDVTPKHNSFVEFMMSLNAHLICNVRAKEKIVSEGGKIESVGVRPIQRKDLVYEFDIAAMMDMSHSVKVTKSRCPALDGKKYSIVDQDKMIDDLTKWLLRGSGNPKSPGAILPDNYQKEINELFDYIKASPESRIKAYMKYGNVRRVEDLSVESARQVVEALRNRSAIATDKRQIESSLANGTTPPPISVTSGDTSENGDSTSG